MVEDSRRHAAHAWPATRRKAERAKGWALAERMTGGRFAMTIDYVVILTRISPKPFDDDNNAAALKSMRDGMAEAWASTTRTRA